ncbi:putative HVA22-like protein g [Juglans regia]|uniref:HVA22-like protein n=1 Tax=Juglans regia TaxID=51240 RepID=A0A2I4E125_JUGRE|nr:putative HVA22-like protein g [Juglans regia]XP_035544833.1 putative HVA22-like protein g [Juglans regia]XP_035544834.1 putative HVA22-like protein g [Juglans regia]
MLGDFITRCLLLLLGYAYPALECYKTVEKNRVGIEELRFWCQYWIIVAILTALERVVDVFMTWFPLYGEMKLALIIYLWYPKTKGTGYVYDTLLRPYVAKHETDIDHKLSEWRARMWDLAIFYWQNCSELGQSAFFQVLQYFAAGRSNHTNNERAQNHSSSTPQPPPNGATNNQASRSGKNKWPPSPSAPPLLGSMFNRVFAQPAKSDVAQVHLNNQVEYLHPDDEYNQERGPDDSPENHSSKNSHLKFRRSKPHY